MADSLSSADVLDGVCAIVECGDSSCLVAHTSTGLSSANDGEYSSTNNIGVLRVDDRLRGSQHTETVLHEFFHLRLPEWKEEAIDELGKQAAALLHLPEVKRRSFG